MVKDLRTEIETSDTQGVLNGDIDRFLTASLAAKVHGGEHDGRLAAAPAQEIGASARCCPSIERRFAARSPYSAGFPVTPQLARLMQCSTRLSCF